MTRQIDSLAHSSQLSPPLPYRYTHTNTHTDTHRYTHTCIHTHTHNQPQVQYDENDTLSSKWGNIVSLYHTCWAQNTVASTSQMLAFLVYIITSGERVYLKIHLDYKDSITQTHLKRKFSQCMVIVIVPIQLKTSIVMKNRI